MSQKCRGHKPDGSPCGQWARRGGLVCNSHGGRAKQVVAKAAERVATEQARAAIRKLTIEPVDNPLVALGVLAGEIVAVKDHLRGEFQRLERLRFEDAKGGEQIRGELQAYQAALRDTVNVLGVIARLDIDSRLARISERQAEAVIAAIDAALDAADVPRDRRADAKRAAAGHLRLIG